MSWDADERTETDQDILDFRKAERVKAGEDTRQSSGAPKAEAREGQIKGRAAELERARR